MRAFSEFFVKIAEYIFRGHKAASFGQQSNMEMPNRGKKSMANSGLKNKKCLFIRTMHFLFFV